MSQDRIARKAQLEAELNEIRQQETQELNKAAFSRIVRILDNADVLLSLISHSRSSCSDDNPSNAHTTHGRGGHFRCAKCGLMQASEQWKKDRDWLIERESAKEIEDHLNCFFGGIEIDITTTVE